MRQGDVFPFRRQVFAIDVHRFYIQNGVGLVYADVNGAEQGRKAPGRIQLFKEDTPPSRPDSYPHIAGRKITIAASACARHSVRPSAA